MATPLNGVALLVIAVAVVWRARIAAGGFLAYDDFPMASRAVELPLSFDYAFTLFNNHLMPAPLLYTWWVTRTFGHDYTAYLVALTVLQAVLGVAFYLLLRRVLATAWGVLLPLAVFLFCPLTLESTSWWAVGGNLLPMQLAMVGALGALVGYSRHRHWRFLVYLGLSMLLGLACFEKSLLIAPLLALFAACLLTGGVVDAARRLWPVWAVVTGVCLAYLGLYLSRAASTVRRPESPGEILDFLVNMVGATLLPGLLGGPWQWLDYGTGDGTPLVAPAAGVRWLAFAVFVAFVVGTVQARRSAGRAWLLLLGYVVCDALLLTTTRLGSQYADAAGLVPRYVGEVVLVAALCIGVVLFGLAPDLRAAAGTGEAPAPLLRSTQERAVALAVAVVAVAASAAVSYPGFSADWHDKDGRDFLAAVRRSLAEAPPGTVFLDRPVPEPIVNRLAPPYHLQSRFFAASKDVRPQFVTQARKPMMIDDQGRIRPVRIDGTNARPNPADPACGYKTSGGQTATIPLDGAMFEWDWTVRIAYIASGPTTAIARFGDDVREIPIDAGLNEIYFRVSAGGDALELTLPASSVTLCTSEVTVGTPHPALS